MKAKRLTKAQKAKIDAQRDAGREQRLQAWERWHAAAHGKTFAAKVTSWDKLRGEGLVYVAEFNATFEIYACNVAGKKTWFPETACVYYTVGQIVDVKFDVHYAKTFVIGLTQGTLDADKWSSLDQDKLAFRCNDDGRPVNGLFAKGASL